jgi:tetratricopeptide (TPR) repeat protein
MSGGVLDPDAFERALAAMSAASAPAPVDEDRWAYREAASVRATFGDFDQLRPLRAVQTGTEARRLLRGDCRLVPAADGGARWSLEEDVRGAALRHLGSATAIARAIELNEAPEDGLQQQLRRLVEREPLDLGALSFGELTHVAQLTQALRGVVPDLPEQDKVEHRLAVADLLSPLHGLTDEGFHGRADVLETLHDHVFGSRNWRDVLNVDTVTQSVQLGVNQLWFTLRDRSRPPLLLHGPGGSGKSTVVAQFLLGHVAVEQPRLLFAQIDFYRPRFAAQEPLTLLGEVLRQAAVQAPALRERAGELRSSTLARLSRKQLEPSATELDSARSVVGFADREWYVDEFGRLMRETLGDERLLVLVLDTLEEVQYRGQDYIEELWYFLGQLQAAVPGLRVIAAGRTPLRHVTASAIALGDLDKASGRAFLRARLDSVGIDPSDIVEVIIRRLGCNPLTLKLATDVVRDAGPEALRDALSRRQVRRKAEAEAVQGVLYRRILDHLHDPPIKLMALPGLALRAVTPALIRYVLAPACSLDVTGDAEAVDLHERFAREVTLVERSRDGSLRYRNDVRRLALRLLATGGDVPLQRVHELAVRYFESQDDDDSRAEEIYHRLRLGQDRDELDPRWRPELSDRLGSALDDLQGRQYVWLATNLGVTLSSAELKDADQAAWESHAERRARYYIELEDPRRALALLRERKRRLPGSRLAVLETVALEQLGRHREAAKLLERAHKDAARSGDDRLVIDLALASARVRHRLGDAGVARDELDRAVAVSHVVADPLLELRVLLAAADLSVATTEERLAVEEILARIPPERLADEPQLLSAAAGAFGEQLPTVLRFALRTIGLPGLRLPETIALGRAFEQAGGPPADSWQLELYRARRSPGAAAELVAQTGLQPPVAAALAAIYRDRAKRGMPRPGNGDDWREGSSPVPIWANPRTRKHSGV